MERRAFDRVPANLPVKYYCDDHLYSGTVRNMSEKGMYISTENFLPCINTVEIHIPVTEEISKFSARIMRIEKTDDSRYSMGVEIDDPPDSYLHFVCLRRCPVRT